MEKLKWETVQRKVSKLIPCDFNPRSITEEGKEKMRKSLEEFDLVEIPVIDYDEIIIAGHQRIEALFVLDRGEEIIDVRFPNRKLTEKEFKGYMLLSNKHFGEFDFTEVEGEFSDFDLSEFNPNIDLKKINNKMFIAGEEDDFNVDAETIKTDIVLGDLFEIGEHRLLCGDSTCSDTVAKLMNGEKADMVFTDPPYNVNYGNIIHPKFKQRNIENDNMSGAEFKDFCQSFVSNIKLFCDGVVYCWAGPGKDGRIMFTALDEALHNSTMIVWNKDQFILGRGKYQNKNEVCWFGWNKSGETFTNDRTLTNVWDFDRPKKSELHPTMKPIKLVENGLNHNPKAHSVLDLFLGSGSTMLASHQLKRKCYGMELDEKYCDVIIRRMLSYDENLTIKRNGIDETEIWKQKILETA